MWEINYDISKCTYPIYEDATFLKASRIYIPYIEVGLKVLLRKESKVSLMYETILGLINKQWNNVDDISEITGIETEILNSIIGDMSSENLLHIKGNTLYLTPEGKNVLNQLLLIKINKEQINQIFINGITGKICTEEIDTSKLIKYEPYLDTSMDINVDYFRNEVGQLNNWYEKQRIDGLGSGLTEVDSVEIYKVLEIVYENVHYHISKLYVYIDNETNKELRYIIAEDTSDQDYREYFKQQIKHKPCARNLLANIRDIQKATLYSGDRTLVENTLKLIKAINTCKKKFKVIKEDEEIKKYYFNNRYLLPNEIKEILYNIKTICSKELLISGQNLSKMLDDNVIQNLGMISKKHPVTLIYEEGEKENENILKKINLKKYPNIRVVKKDSIIGTKIEIDKKYMIESVQKYIKNEEGVLEIWQERLEIKP